METPDWSMLDPSDVPHLSITDYTDFEEALEVLDDTNQPDTSEMVQATLTRLLDAESLNFLDELDRQKVKEYLPSEAHRLLLATGIRKLTTQFDLATFKKSNILLDDPSASNEDPEVHEIIKSILSLSGDEEDLAVYNQEHRAQAKTMINVILLTQGVVYHNLVSEFDQLMKKIKKAFDQ